jgi:hypothetical protein
MQSTIRWVAPDALAHAGHPRSKEAVEAASYILWALSGRKYTGVRKVTEVYSPGAALTRAARDVGPVYSNGQVWNTSTQCCCTGCGIFHRIRLRGTPARRIVEVWVDGTRLSPDEYVLLDHGTLGFLNSVACCAGCIRVTYLHGSLPPGGEDAAKRLADELLASADGEECSLPQRVTSISRQGVSWTLLDPQEFLRDRRTGIYEIDLLLAAINPAKALLRPRVFSPDLPRAETWSQMPPPPHILVEDGDQVVSSGHDSLWIVDDYSLRQAVEAGEHPRTQIGCEIRRMKWDPVIHSDSAVSLTLSKDDVCSISDGDEWAVYDDCDTIVASGQVRVI